MPGMKKSPRPTPNPRRSGPVSRGNAASRRQQSEQDDVLKNGGRGMKAGGKVKKMRAGGGSMSSTSLRERITDDSLARDRNLRVCTVIAAQLATARSIKSLTASYANTGKT
jgi:hypothetical protein